MFFTVMWRTIASCLVAAASVQAAVQRAADSDPVVPALENLRSVVNLTQADQLTPIVLGKPLPGNARTNLSETCATSRPIQGITIDVELLLTRAPSNDPNSQTAVFGDTPPRSPAPTLVSLPIERYFAELLLVGRTTDRSTAVVHVTALSLESNSDFARFTIDAVEKIAIGTLVFHESVYRIVPEANRYSLYKLEATDPHRRPRRYQIVTQNCGRSVVSELERRHVQMEVLADVQPWRVRVDADAHYVLLQGGELGRMPPTSDPEDVLSTLRVLEPLTQSTKDTALRITDVFRNESTNSQARVIRFEQVVGAISVDRRNEIRIDRDGRITEIASSILDDTISALPRSISEGQALDRAREALRSELTNVGRIESVAPAELKYHFVEGATLVPTYRFGLSVDSNEHYWVSVNANSGATQTTPMAVQGH
jgi:hypothetical protein